MSAVHNARTRFGRKTIRKEIARSGQARRGKMQKKSSSKKIPYVPPAGPPAKSRTIPKSISMGRQIIWSYQGCRPYVNPVITVDIPDDSNVHLAARLAVNPKVTSAIVACLEVIENELSIAENTGNDSKTKAIRSTGNGLKDSSKTNRSHLPALARLDECCGGA